MKKYIVNGKNRAFTYLVKPFRSNLLTSALGQKFASQTKFRNIIAQSYGFTLAETLIVAAILGVIAVLVIPNLIRNQIESQNRIKVKKAMSVYERALSKIVIENDLRNNTTLTDYNNSSENANCTDTFKYFKASKGSGCIFMTTDKIWWNIENIQRPVISFKEITSDNKAEITAKANDLDDKEAFVLVGRFQDSISALRIDDLAFEKENSETVESYNSYDQVAKLFGFINKVKAGDSASGDNYNDVCETRISCDSMFWRCFVYDCHNNYIADGLNCLSNTDMTSCKDRQVYVNNDYGDVTVIGYDCSDINITSCHDFDILEYGNNPNNKPEGYYCSDYTDITSCDEIYIYTFNDNKHTGTGYNCENEDITSCKECKSTGMLTIDCKSLQN